MKVSELTYKRVDANEVKKRLSGYTKQVKNASSAEEIKEVIERMTNEFAEFSTMSTLASIRNTNNVNDAFYIKEKEFYDKVEPKFGIEMLKLNKALISSKHIDGLKKLIAPVAFKNIEMSTKCINRKVVLLMLKESQLINKYNKTMGNLKITVNGKSYNSSTINKLFNSSDREVRRRAMEEYGKTLGTIKNDLDEIYGSLVTVRSKIAARLKMMDYVEYGYNAMNRNCYDRHDVSRFRANVKKHVVPLVNEIKEEIAKRYEWDKIKLYDDNIYTDKEPVPEGTPEELLRKAKEMYIEMGKETGELFSKMLESESFDVISRDGKIPGGYCTTLPAYKIPYVFANFNCTAHDVEVLTHEFGHALAANNSFNFNMLEDRPTYESCEVHSMSMEYLTYPWMKNFFGESTDDFTYYHIASSLCFIPYGTIVDAFQHTMYEKPKLTFEQRNEHWANLEKEYQPYKTNEGIPFIEEGRRWQLKHHIYDRPFYYIDYCLAQMVAFQILVISTEDREKAFNTYMKFLKPAGTMSFTDLIKHAGLKNPFEEESFIEICTTLRKILLDT